MFEYWGFGLTISSEICFPELLEKEFKTTPDVKISIGNIPDYLQEKAETKRLFYLVKDKIFLLNIKDTAKYYAHNGNEIIIQPEYPVTDERGIRLYVLATVMAAVLLQRGIIPLHASAIKINNRLVLFSGASHAGKSTVLAELMKKGYTAFSDDIVVCSADNSHVNASASYPMLKLWDDTIDKLKDPNFNDRSFSIKKDMSKYGHFFHKNFDTEKHPINKIFIIKPGAERLSHNTLEGKESFTNMIRQIYRPGLIKNPDLKFLCFNLVLNIIKQCKIIEIGRPENSLNKDLCNYIESFITETNT